MKHWVRRLRGAVGMGITWAVGWVLVGLLIGIGSKLGLPFDAFFRVFDAPLPALALPGFIGGVLFSGVLGVVGRQRRFHELSLPRFTAWGALGGILLSLVPVAMAAVGLAHLRDGALAVTGTIIVPVTLMCAASAAGSLYLARKAERQELETVHRGQISE